MNFRPIKLMIDNAPSDRYAVVTDAPEFSWSVEHEDNTAVICAYRICVKDGDKLLWDSGRREGGFSARYDGEKLVPGMRPRWQLRLWDDKGNSGEAFGEFRVVPKTIDAQWITKPNSERSRPIYLAKQFEITKDIKRADLYVSGIGYQSVRVNGRKADSAVLQPITSNYKRQCYFAALEAENLIKKGKNCIGVKLGDGWRRNYGVYLNGASQKENVEFFGTPQLALELRCEYCDGSIELLKSDESWYAFDGGTIRAHLFDGETYDARKEPIGWDTAEYDYSDCVTYAIYAEKIGGLKPQRTEPIREQRRIRPISKIMIEPGVYIFDFGENITGYPEIRIPDGMTAGDKISMIFAEEINENGDLERNSMRAAESLDEYISNGHDGGETWSPEFVYHGFRYMRLSGWRGVPDFEDVAAVVVYSDVDNGSYFNCGSALVNQIHENVVRGERGNLHGIATDCPQRDERMGWLNDATVRFEETPYNFNVSRLFPKIIADINAEQDENGAITCTAPYIYGSRPADPVCSSYLVLGWQCWLHYANKSLLRENYRHWRAWNDCLANLAEDGIISYSCYGDWAGTADSCKSFEDANSAVTPDALMSTGYHYYNYRMLAKMAEVLGDSEEQKKNNAAAERVKKAFLKKWYNEETGVVATGSQGSQAFALWLGILPEEERQKAADRLHDAVAEVGFRFKCGNLTARYVLEMLSDYGYIDDAWKIMTREEYPSFGYMIQNGATTIWERFEQKNDSGMNSHNHPMYGAVGAWFYSRIAGLVPKADGWKKFALSPKIPTDLQSAEAHIDSVRGSVDVKWFKRYGKLNIHVNVPYGAECEYEYGGDKKILKQGFYCFSYDL